MIPRARYKIDSQLRGLPANLVELSQDACAKEFLLEAKTRRSAAKDAVATALRAQGFSLTDANAMVDRGRMFLFGKSHIDALFGGSPPSGRLLLDVGAGDGNITSRFASKFEKVIATEYSQPMVTRLNDRGYIATSQVDAIFDQTLIGDRCMDLIMLLNVLDRADKPVTLLKQLKKLLKPKTGRLLLAVVLPWCPFVEVGREQRRPSEKLSMKGGLCNEGASFETSVSLLAKNVLIPLGFEVESWTKLPYLCEGDGSKDYYVLDDAVFVLKIREDEDAQDTRAVIEPGILSNIPEPPAVGVVDWALRKVW